MPVYLNRPDYDRLVASIRAVEADPFNGTIDDSAIKLALGEADVWPASILGDVFQEARRERELFEPRGEWRVDSG